MQTKFAHAGRRLTAALAATCALGLTTATHAGAAQDEVLNLSLEDLLKTEVTTASRKSQALQATAAAVFVITREDIERSGVLSLPDALQMAPGVHVARIANNHWAVSVRGFNGRFANKLLVLVDGRSIYSPLFSGVLWELEDMLLEDIDRIEVIRGPGASMWGANAVNGVINIITRKARDTQGNLVVAGGGDNERLFGGFRHGNRAGSGHYRVWGKVDRRDVSPGVSGEPGNDDLLSRHVGFRGDWSQSAGNRLMVTGEAFNTPGGDRWDIPDVNSPAGFRRTDVRQVGKGGHLLGRQEWILDDGSEAALQSYVAVSDMQLGSIVHDRRTTFDIDFQHRKRLWRAHDVMWGLGYRTSRDDIETQGMIHIDPNKGQVALFSAFVHDEIALAPQTLTLILGTRVEHNSYTGWEPQPNLRLLWTPTGHQTAWGALSRAVRTPARAEIDGRVDLQVSPAVPPFQPAVLVSNVPDGNLDSEKVTAFELGYRHQFEGRFSLDLTGFNHRYRDLRTAVTGAQRFIAGLPPYVVQEISPDNGGAGHTYGAELALEAHASSTWRLQASYTYMRARIRARTQDPVQVAAVQELESSSPQHQLSLRSLLSLPGRQQLDLWVRMVSALDYPGAPQRNIPSYTTADLRYAWRPSPRLELSLVGTNLFDGDHPEFLTDYLPSELRLVERSFHVKAKWQF